MFKKLLTASVCLLLGTTLVMGEEEKKDRFFKLRGSYEAGYKIQSDFKNPWDARGKMLEGSGNRSKQEITQSFDLTLLAIKWADGPKKYPEWMVYSQIKADPNDPDRGEPQLEDDSRGVADIGVGEAFLLWKPHMALDIKIGKQTILATLNRGHNFYGPTEFDLASIGCVNTGFAGLTVAGYLGSSDHKVGISMLNGSPKVSELYEGGMVGDRVEGAEKDTIIWYEGSLMNKALKIKLAQQSIAIINSETTTDGVTSYDESENHTVSNLFVSYDMGFIKPWVGYWSTAGKAADGSEVQSNSTSLGFEMKDLGPGMLAFEFSSTSTPAATETGSALPVVDLKGTMSLDYTVEMSKNIEMAFTYRQLNAGDYWTNGDGKDHPAASYFDWSPTTMIAASVNYKFN